MRAESKDEIIDCTKESMWNVRTEESYWWMWVFSGGFSRGLTFAGSWDTTSTFRLSYMALVERRERSDETSCLVATELTWDTYCAPVVG